MKSPAHRVALILGLLLATLVACSSPVPTSDAAATPSASPAASAESSLHPVVATICAEATWVGCEVLVTETLEDPDLSGVMFAMCQYGAGFEGDVQRVEDASEAEQACADSGTAPAVVLGVFEVP